MVVEQGLNQNYLSCLTFVDACGKNLLTCYLSVSAIELTFSLITGVSCHRELTVTRVLTGHRKHSQVEVI